MIFSAAQPLQSFCNALYLDTHPGCSQTRRPAAFGYGGVMAWYTVGPARSLTPLYRAICVDDFIRPAIVLIETLYSSIRCSFWPFTTHSSKGGDDLSKPVLSSVGQPNPSLTSAVWGNTARHAMQVLYHHHCYSTEHPQHLVRWRG